MSKAKCIMVQGTMSGAGKSLLCAALCRIFAQDGYRVAPFKSQNMALNSFVTRDGLEMGRAQVVQAQAAGIEPDVRMNPILLKPSSDVGSQVIVNGEVRGQMPAAAYFKMKRALIPEILSAYNSLAETVDIIVIEGAGSPAEINLKADDIVNMGLARLGGSALCYMADPEVARIAAETGTTRAVASMHRAAQEHPGAILAVGNAPTALLAIAEEIEAGLRPALVIAVPVGFVNVVESKEALFAACAAHGVPAIAAMGRKGGSTVAAAVCNALVYSAAEMLDPAARGWK